VDETEVAYGLPPVAVPGLVAVATILAGLAFTTDVAGGIAGAVLAAAFLFGAVWASRGPVLRADADGASVRGFVATHRLHWSDVIAIHAQDQRRGRGVEFETADGLVFVPAALLGRHSTGEVYEAVSALWERHRLEPPAHPG